MTAAVSRCRSCRAQIRWATTVNGRGMPLDPDPVPDGNVVVDHRDAVGGLVVRVLEVEELQPGLFGDDERERFVSHFATCPNADEHRRPR